MTRGWHVVEPCLVVEDEPGDLEYEREMLLALGFEEAGILTAGSLEQGLTCVREHCPQVVLLDLRLPDAVGLACVDAMVKELDGVPLIVLTGVGDEELALACIVAGAQDYLNKSELKLDSLQRALGYAVARSHERRERLRANALQRRLAAIVEASSDAIVGTDMDGRITSWNQGALDTFGYSAEEALGMSVAELIRPVDGHEGDAQALHVAGLLHGERMIASETTCLRRSGERVHLSVAASRLTNEHGEPVGLAAILRDITSQRERDQALQESNQALRQRDQQLRALVRRLNQTREQERTRISREVHDELGALLTALKMDLRWVSRKLALPVPHDLAAVDARLKGADALVDTTIQAVQRLALELRPGALDSLGLAPAVRDEVRRFSARYGIVTDVYVDADAQPEPEVATELFRILQELLTNVARHAKAAHVELELRHRDGLWTLSVSDDGVGIEEHAIARETSLGLQGMRERANALGGELALEPQAPRGTIARVSIPAPPGPPS